MPGPRPTAPTPHPGTPPAVRILAGLRWCRHVLLGAPAVIFSLTGCVALGPENTLVSRLEPGTTDREWERLEAEPVALERPVIVLSGYRSPPMLGPLLEDRLRSLTSGREEDFLSVSYIMHHRMNEIAALVVNRVEERWPSDDPHSTIEVDVVAISMGGLIGRLAALPPERRPDAEPGDVPPEAGKRLRIARLMTLATPHRGAKLAQQVHPDSAARAMRPGSNFIIALNERTTDPDYELICYAHTHDLWVGATNTAPPGMDPIWVRGSAMFSHFSVSANRLLIADMARRLRGEPPLLEASSPPPSD